MVHPITSKEAELLMALQKLGAKRVEATLVASLAEQGSLGTRDLVAHTGLRQPEVSVGMQQLRLRHWVEAQPVPRNGKGRPMHRYRLVAHPDAVRRHYEEEGRRVIHEYEDAITVVKRHLA